MAGVPLVEKRGMWKSKFDFSVAFLALTLGFQHIFRFPYLVFKNGGGVFLIMWLVCTILVGFPLVLLEVALGQHTGLTGLAAIGKAAPVLKGIGFSILTTNFMYNIYSPAMIISWAATYFFRSFSNLPDLPWTEGCRKSSASLNCSSSDVDSYNALQFWEDTVLEKSPSIDAGWDRLKWPQLVCLLATWTLVASILCKGLPRAAKVLWVTLAGSCFLLLIFLFRAVALPGAGVGLQWAFLLPDWTKFIDHTAWNCGW